MALGKGRGHFLALKGPDCSCWLGLGTWRCEKTLVPSKHNQSGRILFGIVVSHGGQCPSFVENKNLVQGSLFVVLNMKKAKIRMDGAKKVTPCPVHILAEKVVAQGGEKKKKKICKKEEMPTTLSVPRRSPIQVLTKLNAA